MQSQDNSPDFQRAFFQRLGNPLCLMELFDFMPEVYVYAKNIKGQYVRANKVVCRVFGVAKESEIVGLTDFDFFPPAIAAQYIDEDRRVIKAQAPLIDQIWLVPDSKGIPQLYTCNKIPLLDHQEKVIGIAGVKRPYRDSNKPKGHSRLMRVVEFVTQNYDAQLSVSDLANEVDLSNSQLHREFVARFGITPNDYIREVRIGVARFLLETEQISVSDVATRCGFYDQSHLSRSFKTSTGMTPLQYRRRFQALNE